MIIYFKEIKYFQYGMFLMSFILLISAMICTQINNNEFIINIPYKSILVYFFPGVTYDIFSINGVAFFLVFQTFFLIIFFSIALYLGLKILPIRLSDLEKKEIILSPFQAFNKIFFSKVLFGKSNSIFKQSFDLRNVSLNYVADIYIYHFKISNKKNILLSILFILLMSNYFSQSENRDPLFQLLLNYCQINIFLLLIFEFIIYISSKSLITGEKIG